MIILVFLFYLTESTFGRVFENNNQIGSSNINVVFITIDTWNFKHAGFHGYKRNITPFLDQLASNGIVFKETTTPIPVTDPSHASIFTGLYPRVHGLMGNGFKMFNLTSELRVLPEMLRERGYKTGGFVSVFHLGSDYGWDQGFQTFNDPSRAERPAKETINPAIDWLEEDIERDDNFYMWVHLFDPHSSYEPPQKYRKKYLNNYTRSLSRERIYLGNNEIHPNSSAFSINSNKLTANRNRLVIRDSGIYIWTSPENKTWHIRWASPASDRGGFKGSITSEGDITSLRKIMIDRHDKIKKDKNKISFEAWVHKGEEGFDFKTSSSEVTLNLSNFNSTRKGWITGLYDGEIRYANDQLERLFNKMNEKNLTENTLVVVTADHGEALGDHGNYGHGRALYESGVRVPLFIKYKAFENQTIDNHVRTIDILPTVLEILNIKTDVNLQGRSLLPLINGENFDTTVFLEKKYYYATNISDYKRYGIRNGKWKYILSKDKRGNETEIREELYEINEDPGELNNLASQKGELVNEFNKRVKEYLSSERNKEEFYQEYDKKTKEILRDLGYIK